jgi:fatty acid amide hydrolase
LIGGEGALIACHGSPIGIGTDIGGSIRIPAHFNGIFGFKPTPNRLTSHGIAVPSTRNASGQTNIRATVGPLARTTDDLVLVMRSFLNESMWFNDRQLVQQPWRDDYFHDRKRLTIGYYTNDQWFPPAPACIRAVNEAADALRQCGHRVIPYTPIDLPEAVRLFIGIIQADGSRHFFEALENERVNPLYTPLWRTARLPRFIRPWLGRILRLLGEQRNALIVESAGLKTAYEYFDLIIDLKKYTQRWLDDMKTHDIDILLVCSMFISYHSLHEQHASIFFFSLDTCQWSASLSSWSVGPSISFVFLHVSIQCLESTCRCCSDDNCST